MRKYSPLFLLLFLASLLSYYCFKRTSPLEFKKVVSTKVSNFLDHLEQRPDLPNAIASSPLLSHSFFAKILGKNSQRHTTFLPYPAAPAKELSAREAVDFPGARVLDSAEEEVSFFKVRQRLLDVSASFKYPYLRVEELLDKESGNLLLRLEMVANTFMVVLPEDQSPENFLSLLNPRPTAMERLSQTEPIYRVTYDPKDVSLESLPNALEQVVRVSGGKFQGEADYVVHTTQRPSNPLYYDQWGLWKVNDIDFSKQPYDQLVNRYAAHLDQWVQGKEDIFDEDHDFSTLMPWQHYVKAIDFSKQVCAYLRTDKVKKKLRSQPRDAFSTQIGINAEEGWDIRTSAASTVVAVLDTGIRYTHHNLSNNMWHNPHPDPQINDLYGKNFSIAPDDPNFFAKSGDITDDMGHGTHCAGIIGGEVNPMLGVAGVAWHVQLMACKVFGPSGSGAMSDIIVAMDYAKEHGAQVINASLGANVLVCKSGREKGDIIYFDGTSGKVMRRELTSLHDKGIILVVSSGNSGVDTKNPGYFYNDDHKNRWVFESEPACFSDDFDNVVSVAATDCLEYSEAGNGFLTQEHLAFYSDSGLDVTLAAPGSFILSTYNQHDDSYAILDGTSMAAPFVSGALALMKEEFPTWSAQQLIDHLVATADPLPSLKGRLRGGRLNLARALRPAPDQPTQPPALTPPPPLPPLH